jgi:hypothetical protein
MKLKHFTPRTIPLLFGGLTVLTYGLLIFRMGFYWDDWVFAWIAHTFGPLEFIEAFRPFRPLLGPIFTLTTSLLPSNPVVWQIFGLVVRFASVWVTWWTLRAIWPERPRQTLIASLLFLVYPGYGQQWVALTHINQEWIPLIAWIWSLGLTASALRNPNRFFPKTIAAVLLGAFGLFCTEYFLGLEPLRLLVIFFILPDTGFWQKVKNSLRYWLPYLCVWLGNMVWLYFYYRSGVYQSYQTGGVKLFSQSLTNLAVTVQQELFNTLHLAGFQAWVQSFTILGIPLNSLTFWLTMSLACLSFVLIFIYLWKVKLPASPVEATDPWAIQAIIIGFTGILLGRLPSWVAGLPLSLDFDTDRLMISMMLGSTLFITGFIEWLIKSDQRKIILYSLLLGLAIGRQFWLANSYRRDWKHTQDFFWQLTWRIPGMQPGTILLTDTPSIHYQSDLQLTAPLNWVYAPQAAHKLIYALMTSERRLGTPALLDLEAGLPVTLDMRTARFASTTDNIVVFYFPPEGCLKILDQTYTHPKSFFYLPIRLHFDIALSEPSRIIPDATPPDLPEEFFGKEPAHGWCYFYTKAELARQVGDWAKVKDLGDQALAQNLAPIDPYEWLPFIEGYTQEGNMDEAVQLTYSSYKRAPDMQTALCQMWNRVRLTSEPATSTPDQVLKQLKCEP